jgi:hypothetical protein
MATHTISVVSWPTERASAAPKLTPRGRAAALVLFSLGLVILAIGWLAGASASGLDDSVGVDGAVVVAGASGGVDGQAVHVVERGDTLWDIASRMAPGSDPRPIVDQIKQLNGLDDSRLSVGQRLRLPAPPQSS